MVAAACGRDGVAEIGALTTTELTALPPAEVARRVGLSRAAIYRAIERGELPAYKLCGRLRVDPNAVEAWKAANAIQPRGSQAAPPMSSNAGSLETTRSSPIANSVLERLRAL